MKKKILIGIDEAGRGPLAGPVSVCALAVLKPLPKEFRVNVKDSKQLSEEKREEWYKKISLAARTGYISFAVSFSSAQTIDKKGIVPAVRAAIKRALLKLAYHPKRVKILLDGSLSAPVAYENQKTIIRGDETVPVIALASIIAKVRRDRRMKRYATLFPGYGFEVHKGYGTKSHYAAIKLFGFSILHRRSFLRNL